MNRNEKYWAFVCENKKDKLIYRLINYFRV